MSLICCGRSEAVGAGSLAYFADDKVLAAATLEKTIIRGPVQNAKAEGKK